MSTVTANLYLDSSLTLWGLSYNSIGWVLFFIFLCSSVWALIYGLRNDEKIKKEDFYKILNELRQRNAKWIGIWGGLLVLLFGALYFLGKITPHESGEFWISKGDGLLVGATIIAIIGAIWAVLARVDAERAFEEAKLAKEASEKTLEAIGNSFPFEKILDYDHLPSILLEKNDKNQLTKNIKLESNTSYSFFLGFPCLGYLSKYAKSSNNDFQKAAVDMFHHLSELIHKIDSDMNDDLKGIRLNITLFPKKDVMECLNALCNCDEINQINTHGKPKDILKEFYNNLDSIKGRMCQKDPITNEFVPNSKNDFVIKDTKDNVIIINEKMNFEEEKFRFITFSERSVVDKKEIKMNAIIWIADLRRGADGNIIEPFESAAFKTNDSKFIEVLNNVYSSNIAV